LRLETVRCHLLGTPVTRLIDFEGTVDRVICSEYDAAGRTCRLKRATATAPPLSRLLQRVDRELVGDESSTCVLG
jgi:hypothetical protein